VLLLLLLLLPVAPVVQGQLFESMLLERLRVIPVSLTSRSRLGSQPLRFFY
jgi:hypothetical protein